MPVPGTAPLRLFIAVDLPAAVRVRLSRLQEELRASGADVKWVEPENIHLTLKFLGDTPNSRVPDLENILESLAQRRSAIPVNLDKLDGFPSLSAPRVIWVGLRDALGSLKKTAQALEDDLDLRGFPKEHRPFQAHITLGRVRSDRNRLALSQKLREPKNLLPPDEFLLDNITLFESRLTLAGAIHSVIRRVALG